jgi:hypothetical protein
MNTINVIAPYKSLGMWVFDDPRVGLVQEPFVSGADSMIDRVVADIPDAVHGFTLIFSGTPFPGHQYRLDWRRGESGGNWYYAEAPGHGRLAVPCASQIFRRAAEAALRSDQGSNVIFSKRGRRRGGGRHR